MSAEDASGGNPQQLPARFATAVKNSAEENQATSQRNYASEQRELFDEENALIQAWRSNGGTMGYCPPEVKKLLTREQYRSFLDEGSTKAQ